MKKLISLLFIIIGIVNTVKAQQIRYIDSLEQLVVEETNYLRKSNLLGQLVNIYYSIDLDKAIDCAKAIRAVLPPEDDFKSYITTYNILGSLYGSQGKPTLALIYLDSALQ